MRAGANGLTVSTSGTNASSTTTVLLPVPRMPLVCQVSRIVISRWGSSSGGSTRRAIRDAQALEDPVASLRAMVSAASDHWELQGHILLTLKAVAELEPGAIEMIEDQRRDQREGMERIARGLDNEGRLGDLSRSQAASALHLITSVESFMELRRNAGLSLVATKKVLMAMAEGLFDLS